jgi:hypothetical protein
VIFVWTIIIELNGKDQPYPRVTIDALPDNALLDIFDFYVAEVRDRMAMWKAIWKPNGEDAWHPLVHVCQRWRHIVLASPCRLCLELLCTNRRLIREELDIWPVLPIVIHCDDVMPPEEWGVTHIISALKRHHLVRRIYIAGVPSSLLGQFTAMKNPFPALTDLTLSSDECNPPILTDSFLGGCAPRLQNLDLCGIPFPGLGRLLLSTSHLVKLSLRDIPESGYIPPEAMVTSLSTLTRLKELVIDFIEPLSPRYLPSLRNVVLPALTNFEFKGDSKYLEGFLSLIDAPSLEDISMAFSDYPSFGPPLLRLFLSRTEAFKTSHQVDILFYKTRAKITLCRQTRESDHKVQEFRISCRTPDFPLIRSLPRLCSSFLSPLLTVERLCIVDKGYHLDEDRTAPPWLELLAPFISVKDLDISCSRGSLSVMASALGDQGELTGERTTEVLPELQNIFLGHVPSQAHIQEAIARFVAARRLSGRPVTVDYQGRREG